MILRIKDVCQLVGLSRSTVYALVARGEFPCQLRLTAQAVGWQAEAIREWMESRPPASHRVKSRHAPSKRRASGTDPLSDEQ